MSDYDHEDLVKYDTNEPSKTSKIYGIAKALKENRIKLMTPLGLVTQMIT